MPAALGPARKPAKLPAMSDWQPPPVQPAVAPTGAVENWPLRILVDPAKVYVALPNPTASPVSASCAVVKLTLMVPPEIKVPTAPLPESVGRVPPIGEYDTWPEVGIDVARLP